MIGVISNPDERSVVCEFFELFKTPWEFYRDGKPYDVVLSTTGNAPAGDASKLILVYGGQQTPYDAAQGIALSSQNASASMLSCKHARIPVYGSSATFEQGQAEILADAAGQPALVLRRSGERTSVRIGYNLFQEIATLLTAGQPVANAGSPALDLHISLLRDLIVESGALLVEIPPVPEGYRFIACLTHDVDHPTIRAHRFDHTALGFLYRAIFGSVRNAARGRSSLCNVLKNWQAALKLPFVYLGLAKDFWRGFDDYLKLENGLASSFFIIPFKNQPGRTATGLAPKHRGAGYAAAEIADDIQKLVSAGAEVGVHGIDAWIDSASGAIELDQIRRRTGKQELGTRMHWLYFDNEKSPLTLEQAGFQYDSTVGYNGTVGYRAGTSQVYKPLNVAQLLELPLHIMDTALFYPAHLNLSSTEARARVAVILNNAAESGGTVTINWHDRSMAPERLWGDFYAELIEELKSRGAWFSTASQAVSWFRKRRAIAFENVSWEGDAIHVKVSFDAGDDLPGMRLRIYNPRGADARVQDLCLKQSFDIAVTPVANTLGKAVNAAASR